MPTNRKRVNSARISTYGGVLRFGRQARIVHGWRAAASPCRMGAAGKLAPLLLYGFEYRITHQQIPGRGKMRPVRWIEVRDFVPNGGLRHLQQVGRMQAAFRLVPELLVRVEV